MRLGTANVQRLCKRRGESVSLALKKAGVSRNAYYSLARREEILPGTVVALARYLGVDEIRLLTHDSPAVAKAKRLRATAEAVARRHPDADPDNVLHTLILLEEKPIERLRRALIRGRAVDIHRS